MIEVVGNLWDYPADVRVITTNGSVRKDGCAVMGRGCAFEAASMDKTFPALLGHHIKMNGNVLGMIGVIKGTPVLSFPVKHLWMQKADPTLIKRSAEELRLWADMLDIPTTVVMPRPGCGNGQLNWTDVRPIIEPILDDRFHVITFGGTK
jgi:hypothetical protein